LEQIKTIIRAATPDDATPFYELLLMSAPFYETLFGKDNRSILTALFRRRSNLFSHEHTFFAESGGSPAGMLLCYSHAAKRSEAAPTALLLFSKMKLETIMKFPVLAGYYRVMDIVRKGDFYLNNLAVFPEFRGAGIGAKLMAAPEPRAKAAGAVRLTLEAEKENTAAIRLYQRLGFSTYEETHIHLQEKIEFLRMAKPL
jgi:ribosomal protein S18 acetylase RimI-like enzyme